MIWGVGLLDRTTQTTGEDYQEGFYDGFYHMGYMIWGVGCGLRG